MEVLFGLIVPIVIVVLTYSKTQHEKKMRVQEYEQLIKKAAEDILNEVKKLPSPKDC